MTAGAYTRLGARLWDWEPFIQLDPTSRVLWLGLYTSAEAKRVLPGLFHGSITAMGDAARLPVDEVVKSLDRMIELDVAEYDQRHRVLRLTELPDAGEYPKSPTMLQSWWGRFLNVPDCQVRNAHVSVIRWILDQGARESKAKGGKNANLTGRPTAAHEELWADTFGTIPIPAPRRRGTRRLVDSIADTSTAVQPSLFAPVRPSSLPELLPPVPPSPPPPDKEIRGLGSDPGSPSSRIPDPNGEGEGEGEGGSSFSSGSDPGSGPPTPSGSSASGGGDLVRPHLVSLPPVQPYDRMLVEIATATNGRYKPLARDGLHAALCGVARELDAAGVTVADLALVGRWVAQGVGIGAIPGDPTSRLSVWVATPGNVISALEQARTHEREAAERSADLAELRNRIGL